MSKVSTTIKLIIFFLVCAGLFLVLGVLLSSLGGIWTQVCYTGTILLLVATVLTIIIGFFKWLFINKSTDNEQEWEA